MTTENTKRSVAKRVFWWIVFIVLAEMNAEGVMIFKEMLERCNGA